MGVYEVRDPPLAAATPIGKPQSKNVLTSLQPLHVLKVYYFPKVPKKLDRSKLYGQFVQPFQHIFRHCHLVLSSSLWQPSSSSSVVHLKRSRTKSVSIDANPEFCCDDRISNVELEMLQTAQFMSLLDELD